MSSWQPSTVHITNYPREPFISTWTKKSSEKSRNSSARWTSWTLHSKTLSPDNRSASSENSEPLFWCTERKFSAWVTWGITARFAQSFVSYKIDPTWNRKSWLHMCFNYTKFGQERSSIGLFNEFLRDKAFLTMTNTEYWLHVPIAIFLNHCDAFYENNCAVQ